MNIDFSIDEEAEEIAITYNNCIVLKIIKTGDDYQDFKFLNFHKIEDENEALLIKSFARSYLLL